MLKIRHFAKPRTVGGNFNEDNIYNNNFVPDNFDIFNLVVTRGHDLKRQMEKSSGHNKGLAIWRVQCFYETFVLSINFCAKFEL